MALLNIFDIAGSALTAQSQRLNVAASNLANADSVTGPDGQPYRAKQVVFQKVRPRTNWFMNRVIRWRMQRVT